MKYLLWALLIYLAWRWFSAAQARKKAHDSDTSDPATPASGTEAERMVKCVECGLHLPLSEALPGPGERFFCSEGHRNHSRSA